MNLKDLKYLVALADTGHFGKAAERTFVSQPTLSAQLKKLEDYLGVKLVERQPRNVQLTEVGKQVVVRARRMLDEGDQIIALARNNKDPFAGRLKLALIPTIGPYLLPRVMQKIRKALPQLGLMLYEHQTEALLKKLHDGEIDLGIMALPIAQDGMETRELYEEAFTVALPNHHALAAKSTIKVQDLKGQTLLLLEDGHCLRDQALEVCSRVDVREAEDFHPQADGGRRSRHHLASRNRRGIAVRVSARAHDTAILEARADAHGGCRLAQIEHPSGSHCRGMRHTRRRHEGERLVTRCSGRGSGRSAPRPQAPLPRNRASGHRLFHTRWNSIAWSSWSSGRGFPAPGRPPVPSCDCGA